MLLFELNLLSNTHGSFFYFFNSWRNDTNVILADEMGLGKTVQSVSMLGFLQVLAWSFSWFWSLLSSLMATNAYFSCRTHRKFWGHFLLLFRYQLCLIGQKNSKSGYRTWMLLCMLELVLAVRYLKQPILFSWLSCNNLLQPQRESLKLDKLHTASNLFSKVQHSYPISCCILTFISFLTYYYLKTYCDL